jgi:hypothetical protein
LRGAECVDGQDGAGRVDHEIHHRVVLEYLLPLRLAMTQRFYRVLFGSRAAVQHGFHLPAGRAHPEQHDQGGEKRDNEQYDGGQIGGGRRSGAENKPDEGRHRQRQHHAAQQPLLG